MDILDEMLENDREHPEWNVFENSSFILNMWTVQSMKEENIQSPAYTGKRESKRLFIQTVRMHRFTEVIR